MDIDQNGDEIMSDKTLLKQSVEKADEVGVIGSPSSTAELNVDILGDAVKTRLIGNLGIFNYTQDKNEHYALSQFTEISMRNKWSEDPTIKGLIRQKGKIDPITERQDTHLAKMTVSSVFSEVNGELQPSILGTIPSTGTKIKLLDENIMKTLFLNLQDELFFLGNSYGTRIKMPMWFKHFGSGKQGANEAYHLGVFGKTGSGKSYLSLMMILAYARHNQMNIIVLDPQGEFSKKVVENQEIKELLRRKLNRNTQVINLHNLVLVDMKLFTRILMHANFFRELGIYDETNQKQAIGELKRVLKSSFKKDGIKTWDLFREGVFETVWIEMQDDQAINRIYSSPDPRIRVKNAFTPGRKVQLEKLWTGVANLFKFEGRSGSVRMNELLNDIEEQGGATIFIDLSETKIPEDLYWNETLKFIVIGEIIDRLSKKAEISYKKNELLNTLVVIDEAHRLAPREKSQINDLEILKTMFIDGVRTTRKYGLGWMFISQTLSSLDKRIIEQIRIFLFGFGLSWGIERQALWEIIGGQNEALRLYQMFKDPQSSLGEREYPFMTIGPISPLSFSGTPLFFNALEFPKEFIEINFEKENKYIEKF